MIHINTSISFITDYGKPVDVDLVRDKYGDLAIKNITISGKTYTAKQIRTERRESSLISYAQRYVDLTEYFADELAERETHHFQDNF